MFVSTIIPTVNRQTLSRAVESVLNQEDLAVDFEVIVVNDSGAPLAAYDWTASPKVRVIHTDQHNRSVARNAGASISRGKFLHFLDDDDWMLDGAFQQIGELAQTSSANWLYGGYRLVDSDNRELRECHPDELGNCFIRFLVGEWLPLQVSFIRSDLFFAVGGFAPLEALNEDVLLFQRISSRFDLEGTPELIASIRIGEDTSTTDYSRLQEKSRTMRQRSLEIPGAFSRVRQSAGLREVHADYWHGKLVWIYLTSGLWSLKTKHVLQAGELFTLAFASFFTSIRYFFSAWFWKGLLRSHRTQGWLEKAI